MGREPEYNLLVLDILRKERENEEKDSWLTIVSTTLVIFGIFYFIASII